MYNWEGAISTALGRQDRCSSAGHREIRRRTCWDGHTRHACGRNFNLLVNRNISWYSAEIELDFGLYLWLSDLVSKVRITPYILMNINKQIIYTFVQLWWGKVESYPFPLRWDILKLHSLAANLSRIYHSPLGLPGPAFLEQQVNACSKHFQTFSCILWQTNMAMEHFHNFRF